MPQFRGLDRRQLKLIAAAAMLIDHSAIFFYRYEELYFAMRFVGRLTAPIMAFFVAEGFRRTRNVRAYLTRLGLFALISVVPFSLYEAKYPFPVRFYDGWLGKGAWLPFLEKTAMISTMNVLFTIFFSLCMLCVWTAGRPSSASGELSTEGPARRFCLPLAAKLALTAVLFWLGGFCDWRCWMIFYVLTFYFLRDRKVLMWGAYTLTSAGYIMSLHLLGHKLQPAFSVSFSPIKLGVFLVIPLLLCYNGEPGSRSGADKWFFYIFYPAHLLILGVIRLWTGV